MAIFLAAPLVPLSMQAKLRYEDVPSSAGTGAKLGSWRDSWLIYLPVVWIPEENSDFSDAFLPCLLGGKSTERTSVLNAFRRDYTCWRAALSPFCHVERHAAPPAKAFLGEVRKETQETMYVSTQRIRVQREKSQAPPDLPCLPLYFSEPSWSLPGGVSILCCLWAGWRWPW